MISSLLQSISCSPRGQSAHWLWGSTVQAKDPRVPFVYGVVWVSGATHCPFPWPLWESGKGLCRLVELIGGGSSLTALPPCGWHAEAALAF